MPAASYVHPVEQQSDWFGARPIDQHAQQANVPFARPAASYVHPVEQQSASMREDNQTRAEDIGKAGDSVLPNSTDNFDGK